ITALGRSDGYVWSGAADDRLGGMVGQAHAPPPPLEPAGTQWSPGQCSKFRGIQCVLPPALHSLVVLGLDPRTRTALPRFQGMRGPDTLCGNLLDCRVKPDNDEEFCIRTCPLLPLGERAGARSHSACDLPAIVSAC